MFNKNNTATSFMRRIMLCTLAAVLTLSLFCLAGCGKSSADGPQSAMEAFEVFIDAQKTLDIDAMVSLTPPEHYERYINGMMSHQYVTTTYEEAKAMADTWYGKDRIARYHFADSDSHWLEPDYVTEVTYEITAQYDASKDEAAQLNDFIKKSFGFESTVTDAVLLYGNYTLHGKNGEELTLFFPAGMCIEIDGRWYFTQNTAYWVTFDGIEVTEKVDWVYNWFAQHDKSLGLD